MKRTIGHTTGVLKQLVEPTPEVQSPIERGRVQLLAFLLLVMTVCLVVGVLVRYLVRNELGLEMVAAVPLLALAYRLSRTRHHQIAALFGVVALALPSFILSAQVAEADPYIFAHSLIWLTLPIFFACFVLSLRSTIIADGVILLAVLTLLLIMPPPNFVFLAMALSFLVVVSALSIGAALIFSRNQKAIDLQLTERARVEEELRWAKEELETRVAARTAELEATNERLTTLIQSSPVAVVIVDQQELVTLWNPAAARIFGWSEQEVLGAPPPFLLEGLSPRRLAKDEPERDAATGQEIRVKTREGGNLSVNISKAPLRAADGATVGLVMVLLDISDRRQLEEQLRQSQKMEAVGQLAGGVAHDFNNLLTVINGYTEMQFLDLKQDDPRRQDLEMVLTAGQRASALTEQLLAFSRRQVMRLEVINLNEVLYGMGMMLRRLIREDVSLELKPGVDLWPVEADAGQIEQVIINLVVNASDAMPGGGTLSIETGNRPTRPEASGADAEEPQEDLVVLTIRDTGEGIDPQVRECMFDPFFTTKPVGHGTGLGLSTVYGIVTQSGGDIEVESAPGQGTTFQIMLPRVHKAYAPTAAAEERPSGGRETILVVEDELAVRDLTARMLSSLGYQVLTAEDGRSALAIYQRDRERIDLVLTDVVMPEMGGPQCVLELRKLRADLPVLFMSGYADQALDNSGVLNTGVVVLRKPFGIKELDKLVRRVLNIKDIGDTAS